MNARALPLIVGLLALCTLAGLADAQTLRVGETAAGRMAGIGSTHDVYLDLAAGDRVVLKLRARRGRDAPDMAVDAPGGGQMGAARNNRKNARLVVNAPVTGTYHIRLTANSGNIAGFSLTIKGKKQREYRGSFGQVEFGVIAGSTIEARIRGPRGTDAIVENPKGTQGQAIILVVQAQGRKLTARSGPVGSTDQLRMGYGPPNARAILKVFYPAPRGQISLGNAAAPVPNVPDDPTTDGGNPPAPPPPPAPQPAPTPAPAPAPEPEPDPAPPPPPAGDPAFANHAYLAALLFNGPRDADLEDAVQAAKAHLPESQAASLDRFQAELRDGANQDLIERVRNKMMERRMEMLEASEFSIDRLALLVETERRLVVAAERLARLQAEDAGALLDSAAAYVEALHAAAERIASGREALERTIEMSLRAYVLSANFAVPEAFDVPKAPSDRQALDGIRELDQRLLSVRFAQAANQGEEDALDMMIAAYRTWADVLAGMVEDDVDLALELAEVQKVLAIFEEIAAANEPDEPEPGMVRLILTAMGSDDPGAIEYNLVPHQDIEPDRATGELRFDAEVAAPQEVYWFAADSRAWLMIIAGLDNDCRRIDLLVRPEETAELAGANLEIIAGGAGLEVEESAEGIRIFGTVAEDELISVRWNVEGRQGGFDLRVVAGQ